MLEIICCFKWVVDEAYLKPDSVGKIDLEMAEYKISNYDRNAIEEAVRLKEQYGGNVTAITVAAPDATKGIKNALSRGPDKAYFINGEGFDHLEPAQYAIILEEVIAKEIPYDLIICGEGSSDLYAQQVGPRLAERLGIPFIGSVQKVQIENKQITVERKTDEGVEVLTAPLPVLIAVVPDINIPRVPGVRDTLAASKKPVIEIAAGDLGKDYAPCLLQEELKVSTMERKCTYFGSEQEDIKAFVEALRKTGLLDGR